jgi:hypothetical protein
MGLVVATSTSTIGGGAFRGFEVSAFWEQAYKKMKKNKTREFPETFLIIPPPCLEK